MRMAYWFLFRMAWRLLHRRKCDRPGGAARSARRDWRCRPEGVCVVALRSGRSSVVGEKNRCGGKKSAPECGIAARYLSLHQATGRVRKRKIRHGCLA